jgi:hypothetical protein
MLYGCSVRCIIEVYAMYTAVPYIFSQNGDVNYSSVQVSTNWPGYCNVNEKRYIPHLSVLSYLSLSLHNGSHSGWNTLKWTLYIVKWKFIPNILDSIFQILLSIDIIHPPLELNFKYPPNIFYDIEIRVLRWHRKSGNVICLFSNGWSLRRHDMVRCSSVVSNGP